jgi:hypothetical protein
MTRPTPYLPKRLLQHILGINPMAQPLLKRAKHARSVAIIKLCEGIRVTGCDAAQELLIQSHLPSAAGLASIDLDNGRQVVERACGPLLVQ